MTGRERFQAVLNFEKPDDRLPVIEWATWWDQTIEAWRDQGLPRELGWDEIGPALGLDDHVQSWFPYLSEDCPRPDSFGGGIMEDESDYEALLPFLYRQEIQEAGLDRLRGVQQRHAAGELPVWITLEGGFWFPRTLFGIENHLFSFFDHPQLYHRILNDLADCQLRLLDRVYEILTPDFMTFAEDMSYNKGPMLSRELFDAFLAPYYRKIIPVLKEHGTKVIVDSDGNVERMIPWLKSVGIEGVLPLERKADVDVAALREAHPDFLFIGAFDKMTMRRSTGAMEEEFRRLFPVMKTGGFVPSVDHQTPPDCPLERYREYVAMLHDYGRMAVR